MEFTTKIRVRQLKAMHELMVTANDEEIYLAWIMEMPDEPSEEDFISIAEDDDSYKEVVEYFQKLVQEEDLYY